LYKKSGAEKYKEELKKTELEVQNFDKVLLRRKKLNKWLETLEKEKSIKECI